MRGYRCRNNGASHQDVVAPCPSRSLLSASTNVLVQAAAISTPSFDHSRSIPPTAFALRLGPATFGIFDAFADDSGRQAHLAGPIASALMANAKELLARAPQIEHVDVLAAKLPK
jgi:hypothetical protein